MFHLLSPLHFQPPFFTSFPPVGHIPGIRCQVVVKLSPDVADSIFKYVLLQLAFPNRDDLPVGSFKHHRVFQVTLSVVPNLVFPKAFIRLRHNELAAALMTVPETAVHEYAGPVLCQHDVRSTGKLSDIDSVPVAEPVEFLPQQHFRLRVPGPDMRHTVVPLLGSHPVGHV